MRKEILLPLCILVLVAAGFAWFVATHDRVEERVYVGLKGEAAQDSYLALKRFIRAMGGSLTDRPGGSAAGGTEGSNEGGDGKTVSTTRLFDEFIAKADPNTTLLILGDRRHVLMTPKRVDALNAWLARGGHAVIEAELPERPDSLLDTFQLDRTQRAAAAKSLPTPLPIPVETDDDDAPKAEDKPKAEETPKAGEQPKAGAPPKAPPSRTISRRRQADVQDIALPGLAQPLRAYFEPYQHLVDKAPTRDAVRLHDKRGLRAIQFGVGQGRVTVISNFDFVTYSSGDSRDFGSSAWRRTHIGRFDHAELFWRMSADLRDPNSSPRKQFWMVWGRDDITVWSWLREHAWMALLAFAALLAAWLWHVIPRFGPMLRVAQGQQMSLGHHVEAVGRFMWKHAGPETLFDAMRRDLMERVRIKRPAWVALDSAKRAKALASLLGVTPEAVMRLSEPVENAAEFLRGARLIQKLRAAL
jgi:hypothetical protein